MYPLSINPSHVFGRLSGSQSLDATLDSNVVRDPLVRIAQRRQEELIVESRAVLLVIQQVHRRLGLGLDRTPYSVHVLLPRLGTLEKPCCKF